MKRASKRRNKTTCYWANCECGHIMFSRKEHDKHFKMHLKESEMEKVHSKLEAQLEKLEQLRQVELDDDIVLYAKAKVLDEYKPSVDYIPNFKDIFSYYRKLSNDDLVQPVRMFKTGFFKAISNAFRLQYGVDTLIYLVENNALSIDDVATFFDRQTVYFTSEKRRKHDMISYFLDRGYAIKPKWVAFIIDNSELIHRIKKKYSFTFNEIYEESAYYFSREDLYFSTFSVECILEKVEEHFPKL